MQGDAAHKHCAEKMRNLQQWPDGLQETSKRCPACGMAIQKSAGCNKMTCGNCGAFFCWRCNKEVDGYEHFHSGKCILFDHAEIQRWEVELQVQIERCARRGHQSIAHSAVGSFNTLSDCKVH